MINDYNNNISKHDSKDLKNEFKEAAKKLNIKIIDVKNPAFTYKIRTNGKMKSSLCLARKCGRETEDKAIEWFIEDLRDKLIAVQSCKTSLDAENKVIVVVKYAILNIKNLRDIELV